MTAGKRVLFAAAEIFPMAKTGGLGDVAAALPVALRDAGTDIRLLMPAYPSALAVVRDVKLVRSLGDLQGCGPTDLLLGMTPDTSLPIYLVRNNRLFYRGGTPYHDPSGQLWQDNAQRFALLSAAAAALALEGDDGWRPQLVHANDWHTALIPALVTSQASPRSVLTIHNAAYQETLDAMQAERFGVAGVTRDLAGAAQSFLSIGIATANLLTTVSPTYALEIQTPEFGYGLERLISKRAADLRGILNGIDVTVWNPASDVQLAARYDKTDLTGKSECKQALLAEMRLSLEPASPLIASVSRLTSQKGLDLLLDCLPQLLSSGVGFVLLGTGDPHLEASFAALAQRFPQSTAVRIAYDEALAHRIVAGADMFVMPSRFEPCGLNQMYSQRYGTVPIVHAVGGLADTVADAASPQGRPPTGFWVSALSATGLAAAIDRAANSYRNRGAWSRLQRNGMNQDFSWAASAREYLRVYEDAFRNG